MYVWILYISLVLLSKLYARIRLQIYWTWYWPWNNKCLVCSVMLLSGSVVRWSDCVTGRSVTTLYRRPTCSHSASSSTCSPCSTSLRTWSQASRMITQHIEGALPQHARNTKSCLPQLGGWMGGCFGVGCCSIMPCARSFSGWAPTCDSVHSWWLYSAAPVALGCHWGSKWDWLGY